MADEFRFEGSDLESLARDLKESALRVRVEVDKTVGEVGELIRDEAKELVSKHSKSIPGTIKVTMIPGAAVVSAGANDVPLAALYELGNKGSKTDSARASGAWFRHPVFGNTNVWVQQRRYPFLRPTLDVNRRTITKLMDRAWDEALKPLRLEGD